MCTQIVNLFLLFALLEKCSEAENAIRKINSSNTLGIKADFAFDTKSKKSDPYRDVEIREEGALPYDTEINWNER